MEKAAIELFWHPNEQGVGVSLDKEQVKNWTFALAIIEMAKSAAEKMIRQEQLMAMQRAQMDEAVTRQLTKKLVTH